MELVPSIFPVTCHTNRVGKGSTFVAIKGFKEDGAQYIPEALERGATKIILDQTSVTPEITNLCKQFNATCIPVANTRIALAEHAQAASNNAAKKLKLIGITGTKGKTTTAFLTEYLLRCAGYKTALISTIKSKILEQEDPSNHTTPESDYLHQFFAECVKQGVEYVVMEVSSHALSLHRVHGLMFDAVGFTNLANDHLDFHETLENYFAAKAQLFSMVKPDGVIVVNSDTEWGIRAAEQARAVAPHATIKTFGQKTLTINATGFDGVTITLDGTAITCPSLFGPFNANNIAMATLLCSQANVNPSQAFPKFPGIPGRLQHHRLTNGAHAFVDYAHNALSFQEVLSMLRPYTHHLIVVFGAGGNKPRERRFSMGNVASQYADVIVVTDDNPRFENRMDIINDIICGIPQEHHNKVITIPDRDKAIAAAAALSQPGSIVALLGKGHETYYSIQGKTVHFDDFEQISKF